MRYWLVACTDSGVKVWDLETKQIVNNLVPEVYDLIKSDKRIESPKALSATWSADGNTLYAGFSDGVIRVYNVIVENA